MRPDLSGIELTRRRLLELAARGAGGALAVPLLDPMAALSAVPRWPTRALPASAARRVDPSQFLPASQLLAWQEQLDRMGLRATGSPIHERFVDALHERLARAGVSELRFEPVPLDRWTTDSWSLGLVSGSSAGPVATASYIPYSGRTAAGGVSGALAVVDPNTPPAPGSLAGRIAVFDVPLTAFTYGTFLSISYKVYDPGKVFTPKGLYARPWLGIGSEITLLDALARAGAIAAVGVLDLPSEAAHGAYYPYDGVIRTVPGVYVDRDAGSLLKAAAAAGASARVALPANITHVTSRNLIGVIPGASDELILLHCHTDGTNGVEDNGPNAIVAMSQYLARLPRRSLPRTIMVLLTTGHFHGAIGTAEFVRRHRGGLLRRIAGAVTIEHLGAREWEPGSDGHYQLTGGFEPGTFFTPESSPLVDASYAALRDARAAPGSVLRPYVAAPGSPDGNGWPAEGTDLWTAGAIPTTNYITGPSYLLNWGIPTMDKLDIGRMWREAIAFTQMLIDLSRVPSSRLRRLDLLKH
ncbi:MAG TPA: M28 family peptidase [Solirubrobacteraceae bacterium]|nr:M28 family peptidase [Solirubrobacteraceae bacterium]